MKYMCMFIENVRKISSINKVGLINLIAQRDKSLINIQTTKTL